MIAATPTDREAFGFIPADGEDIFYVVDTDMVKRYLLWTSVIARLRLKTWNICLSPQGLSYILMNIHMIIHSVGVVGDNRSFLSVEH